MFTIKHGSVRKLKKNIHYILDDIHFSYFAYEPHMFVPEPFQTNKSFIAYDRGNSYCDRKYTARVDLINRLYQNNTVNTRCFKYYYNTSRCDKRHELLQCKYATGPLPLFMDRFGVIPDLKKNASAIAYGDLCFLHRKYTLNSGTRMITRVTRDGGVFLLFSLVLGGLMGLALVGTFQNQLRRFSDEINERLENIKKDFTGQLNTVEKQISEINERELQLTQAINRLAEITAHIGRNQEDFQNLQFAVDKQLLEQQIANTRMMIENRKLALSINARDTQREIEEYNLRKLILNTLKILKSIPDVSNDTIYSNRIRGGILITTEIYRIINQSQINISNWEK